MERFLTKQNAVMAGSYVLFLFLRGFVYAAFATDPPATVAVVIQYVTVAEYLLAAFLGAYGAATTHTLRGGLMVALVVKLLSELFAIGRLLIRSAGAFSDFFPFALGRTATIAGITLLAALVTSSIIKMRGNRGADDAEEDDNENP